MKGRQDILFGWQFENIVTMVAKALKWDHEVYVYIQVHQEAERELCTTVLLEFLFSTFSLPGTPVHRVVPFALGLISVHCNYPLEILLQTDLKVCLTNTWNALLFGFFKQGWPWINRVPTPSASLVLRLKVWAIISCWSGNYRDWMCLHYVFCIYVMSVSLVFLWDSKQR